MSRICKITAAGTSLFLMMSAAAITSYADEAKKSEDIVILYTNDVHCGIDINIGYDGLALYKREMEERYENVLLVDAGDAIQGLPVGTLSKGAYITRLMNAVCYDAATLGNHEFDYNLKELLVRADELNCGYVCANFYSKETGKPLFDAYKMFEAGDRKIAFVGATTPETLDASSPIFFQNEKGEFIYDFGEDGSIYERLQTAVDDAIDDGADYVILLAHLGESDIREGWSAPEIVAELSGVDAVIDGHSHETTPGITAKSKDGKDVVITQTGTKLANIGKMTITAEGKITTELIDSVPAPAEDSGIAEDTWLEPDDREGRFVDETVNREIMLIKSEYSDILDRKIGTSDYDLIATDPGTGTKLVRIQETNLGDLCADAYKYVLGADVGITNGGGIRGAITPGDITYKEAMSIFPFGNMTLVAEVTGQQILDILEKGAMKYPEENTSFIQASGIEYTIDESIPSSVKLDDTDLFLGVEGEYRVKDVLINGEPLDISKTYTLACHDHYLKNGSDGYIFTGKCNIIRDDVMSDSDLIAVYIRDTLGGVIPEKYADTNGEGRIKILSAKAGASDTDTVTDEDSEVSAQTAEEENISAVSDSTSSDNPSTGSEFPTTVILVSLAAALVSHRRKFTSHDIS